MKAFEIRINGRYFATVGSDRWASIIHCILEIHGGILNHIVRINDVDQGQWFEWPTPHPKVGDEITIKIVETDQVSPWEPRHLPRKPPSADPPAPRD